jgi:NADPH:quinone reductase-like Zn-dependent oxidoreductase
MSVAMLAAAFEELGGSEVLEVGEHERPEPGPGEVRVRVRISGINPSDWKMRAGVTASAPPDAPQIPHQDGAGEIDAVGAGVDESRLGERVWILLAAWQRRWGTAAQWTVVPAAQAVPLPEEVDFELGACLGIPAVTAHVGLFRAGPIRSRDVLVAGGAGAVGHAAIELATRAGARVVATVSGEEKAVLALAAGAEAAIDYRAADAAERLRERAPEGFHHIMEVALRENLDLDVEVAASGATVVTYADDGRGDPAIPARAAMAAGLRFDFFLIYTLPRKAIAAAVAGVGEALAAGDLTALPLTRFPLAEVAAAHDLVERGQTGKVLLEIP